MLSTAQALRVLLDPLEQIGLQFLPLVATTVILVMRLQHQMGTLFQGPTDFKPLCSKLPTFAQMTFIIS